MIFSPIAANFIGLLVTALIESAAPPLVSPSSFESITPSIPSASSNDFTILTVSCPVIASTTNSISLGLTVDFIFLSSCISSSSIWSLPAVSIITTSKPRVFALSTAF